MFLVLLGTLVGPRLAIFLWWAFDTSRWSAAFDSFWWPLVGILIAPWTTLAYALVAANGVAGWDWVWLTSALLIDLASHAGSGSYQMRSRARHAQR